MFSQFADRHVGGALHEAVQGTRFIGIMFVAVGGMLVTMLMMYNRSRAPAFFISSLVIAPGAFFIIASIFLSRGALWALYGAIGLSVALLIAVAALFVLHVRRSRYGVDGAFLVATICWIGAVASLLRSLVISRKKVLELRYVPGGAFEPIMVQLIEEKDDGGPIPADIGDHRRNDPL